MQHSEPPDSSLQAILYIDTQAATPKKTQSSRLPNLLAIGACVVAATCAVGAITYSMNHSPAAPPATAVAGIPLQVTHQAAAPHSQFLPALASATATPAAERAPSAAPAVVHHVAARPIVAQHAVTPAPRRIALATPLPAATVIPLPTTAPATPRPKATARPTPVAKSSAEPKLAYVPHPHHHHVHRKLLASMPASGTVTAASDPAITQLSLSPTSIPEGSGASLCVAAHSATQLSLSGIGEVNPRLLNCRHVAPNVTTTYTAWAVNSVGVTVSQSVTLTVTH